MIIGKNMLMTRNACEMTIAPRNSDATGKYRKQRNLCPVNRARMVNFRRAAEPAVKSSPAPATIQTNIGGNMRLAAATLGKFCNTGGQFFLPPLQIGGRAFYCPPVPPPGQWLPAG